MARDPALPKFDLKAFPSVDIDGLRASVLQWQSSHGRHGLPWQGTDPYHVWLSEVMLQQTQVTTVTRRFSAWVQRFPTIEALAHATTDEVLSEWEGMGYYSRARRLHDAARLMVDKHAATLPRTREDRLALPGVGPSTAAALGAFVFGEREAIFDGNVERVWSRWWAGDLPVSPISLRRSWLWSWAHHVMPATPDAIRRWTQAVMDLGATVCTPRRPACTTCPLRATCRAYLRDQVAEYPAVPPRKPPIVIQVAWAWQVEAGRLGLRQQPVDGIWGGLWAPPLVLSPPSSVLAQGQHTLTHRRVHWSLHEHALSAEPARWVTPDEWATIALPRPLRRWWDDLSQDQRQACWPGWS